MEDDPIKAAEQRGYSRGYAAGRKKLDTEAEQEARRREHERETRAMRRFRQQVFCAALQGAMASPNRWQTGGKFWRTSSEYAEGCWEIADAAVYANKRPFA